MLMVANESCLLTSHSLVCSSPYWFWGCLWDLLCSLSTSICTSSRDLRSICALGHNILKPSPWVRTSELDEKVMCERTEEPLLEAGPTAVHVSEARWDHLDLGPPADWLQAHGWASCHCTEWKQAVCPREPCLDCQSHEQIEVVWGLLVVQQ